MFRPFLVIFIGIISFFNISAFASDDAVSKASCDIGITTRYETKILWKESFSISRDGSERSKDISLESTNIKLGRIIFAIDTNSLFIQRFGVDNEILSLELARGRIFSSLVYYKDFAITVQCSMDWNPRFNFKN